MRINYVSSDELWVVGLPPHAGSRLRCDNRQHTVAEIGLEFVEIKIEAQAELELIVVLHPFEVERLPVDSHHVGFAGGDDEVRSAGGDLDSVGLDARNEHSQFQPAGQVGAFKVWLAVSGQGLCCGILTVRG